jgi:hypothetical protein
MTAIRFPIPTRIPYLLPILALGLAPPAPAETATFELGNGDKVSGTVVEQDDERIVLEHDVFGRIEIPVAQLKPAEPPNPGLFGTSFLTGWKRTLSLGVSGQEGNSKTTDIVAALDADFED